MFSARIVDQMARMVGAVGEARADPAAALDQIDPLARLAAPKQMDGRHDAAEAGADHDDAAAFACHGSFLPDPAVSASGLQAASVNTLAARARIRTSWPWAQAQLAMAATRHLGLDRLGDALHLQLDADDRAQRADVQHPGLASRPRPAPWHTISMSSGRT